MRRGEKTKRKEASFSNLPTPQVLRGTSLQSVWSRGLHTESLTNMQIQVFMNSSPCVVLSIHPSWREAFPEVFLKRNKKRFLLMTSLKTQHRRVRTFACDGLNAVWGGALRWTVCSLAAQWGPCPFILMDALRFSSSLLRDAGGHAEQLGSGPAAGRVSLTGSRTFQSARCLLRFLLKKKNGGGVWKPLRNTVGGFIFFFSRLENKRRPLTALVGVLMTAKERWIRGSSFNVCSWSKKKEYLEQSVSCCGKINICDICCLHKKNPDMWARFELDNSSLHENWITRTFLEKWFWFNLIYSWNNSAFNNVDAEKNSFFCLGKSNRRNDSKLNDIH